MSGTGGRAQAAPDGPTPYHDALQRLFARRRFGLQPGLEVIRALLAALDEPAQRLPAVHITGSKGKGSVATMTASILTAHGLRVGLFTSPHLASYRERIRLDGEAIDRDSVVEGLARVETAAADLLRRGTIDREPTFFEATTAMALDHFARNRADAAVVEVGIGGRLDATNVLASTVGVLTTVELEHTDLLGPTLESIAREKAGILHPGMTAVTGELPEGAATVVGHIADRAGVPVWSYGHLLHAERRRLTPDGQTIDVQLPGHSLERVQLPLLGSFQVANAALAVAAAVRFLEGGNRPFRPAACRRALEHVRIPGRLDRIATDPELFYDVAHTPESARAVTSSLGEIAPLAEPDGNAIVFGCLAGKNVVGILDAFSPLARTIVLVPVLSERAMPVGELKAAAAGRFARVVVAPDAPAAVRLARAATAAEGLTLVAGSDYLVGELLRTDAERDEPDLSDPGHGPPPVRVRPRAGASAG